MRIANYKLKHNQRSNYYINNYLWERGEALERYLQKKLPNFEEIYMTQSNKSEALYLFLENEHGNQFKISFRNHGNYAGSSYDMAIYLSQFDTWTECKNFFLKEVLPKIINNTLDNYIYNNNQLMTKEEYKNRYDFIQTA